MLNVIVSIEAKEGARDELTRLIKLCAVKTREEEGCIAYDLYVSAENNRCAALLEKWESRDALTAHLETAHYKELMEAGKDLKAKPDEVDTFSTPKP